MRVSENWRFSGSEFVLDSANLRIRVGVDTLSGIFELSSGGACFPSSFAILQTFTGFWLESGFRFRRVGHDKVAGEAARSVNRASPGTENKGCALRHVVGVA